MKRRVLFAVYILVFLSAIPVRAGLDLPEEAKGLKSTSYSLSDYESINLANGNLNFHVPLTSLRTDGGLEYPLVAFFNSKAWQNGPACNPAADGYGVCMASDDGVVERTFRMTGVEAYGFGWDLRPPRLRWTDAWVFIDVSGGGSILQDLAWWQSDSGSDLYPNRIETDTDDAVGDVWYTGDGSNYRFTVKAVGQDLGGHDRATRVVMEKPGGEIYVFSQVSPSDCVEDHEYGGGLWTISGDLYLTEIQQGPWDASGVAANRITFSYLGSSGSKGMGNRGSWIDACPGSPNSPWLVDSIAANGSAGDVAREINFVYGQMSLGSGGNARTLDVLERIEFPEFDPELNTQTSNTDAQIVWSLSSWDLAKDAAEAAEAAEDSRGSTTHLDSIGFPAWSGNTFVFDSGTTDFAVPMANVRLPSGAKISYKYNTTWPISAYWYDKNPGQSAGDSRAPEGLYSCGVSFGMNIDSGEPFGFTQPYIYGSITTFGISQRTKEYRDALGAGRKETTAFAQALSCRAASRFNHTQSSDGDNYASKTWPYDFRWALRYEPYPGGPTRYRGDYLYTVVMEYEGDGAPTTGVTARTGEIHRFHPFSRKEFSVDTLSGVGIRRLYSHALYGWSNKDDKPSEAAYFWGEKLSEWPNLKVIRHTEIESSPGPNAQDNKWSRLLGRYFFTHRSSVFTDESAVSTAVDLKADPTPCYPDVDFPGGNTEVSCTEVKTTRTVDDYLNVKKEATIFDDPLTKVSRQRTVSRKYLDDDEANLGIDVEAEDVWALNLPIQSLTTEGDVTRDAKKVGWIWSDISSSGGHADYRIGTEIQHPEGVLGAPTCSGDCVEHDYGYDDFGNRTTDTVRGGYAGGFDTTGIETRTGYLFAKPSWQAILNDSDGVKLGYWQRDLDPGTGLPRWQVDGAGVGQAFLWDADGRLTDIIPIIGQRSSRDPFGRVSWSFELQTVPQSGEVMKGYHIEYEEPGPSVLLTRKIYDASWSGSTVGTEFVPGNWDAAPPRYEYVFDGLGRLSRESEQYFSGSPTTAYRSRFHLDFLPGGSAPCSNIASGVVSDLSRIRLDSEWKDGTSAPDCPSIGAWSMWTRTELEAQGRPARITQADAQNTTKIYRGDSNVKSTRMIADSIDSSMGDATLSSYQTTTITDALGRLRRLEEQQDGATTYTTDYGYDEMKRLRSVDLYAVGSETDAQTRSYYYSAGGFLIKATEPERETRYPAYDAMGNVITRRLFEDGAAVSTATYSYDDAGRLLTINDTGVGMRIEQNWGDDLQDSAIGLPQYNKIEKTIRHNWIPAKGKADRSTDVSVTQDWTYNGPGARVSERDTSIGGLGASGDHFTIGYDYDTWGNRSRLDFPTFVGCRSSDWDGIEWVYDGPWMKSIGITGDGSQLSLGEMEYHPSGRLHRLSYLPSEQAGQSVSLATWEETADPSGMTRPADISLSIGGVQVPLAGFGQMEYDGVGNIWKIGDALRYSYDGLSRLKEFSIFDGSALSSYSAYTYDRWGNLKTITRPDQTKQDRSVLTFNYVTVGGVPANNRITTVDDGTSKDPAILGWERGNLTEQAELSGLLRRKQYSWSADDRLMRAVDGPVGAETTWKYAYDAAGERVVRWTGSGSTQMADFFIRDEEGQLISEWRYSPGGSRFDVRRDVLRAGSFLIGELDHEYRPDGLLFHAADHLGSTRITFNEYGGIEDKVSYLPFGKLDLAPGVGEEDIDTDLLFTGHERDPGEFSSGLDYLHQRYDSPVLGRFVSVDPVMGDTGSSQSWNRYSYVLNNPIMLVDLDGKTSDATMEYMVGYNRPAGMTASTTPEQKAITAASLGPLMVVSSFALAGVVPGVGMGGATMGLSSSLVVSGVEQMHSDVDFGEKALNITKATSLGTLSTVMPGRGIADTLVGAITAIAINGLINGGYGNDTLNAQDTASQLGSVTNAGFAHLAAAGSPAGGKSMLLRAVFQTALEILKTEFLETPSMQKTLSEIDKE